MSAEDHPGLDPEQVKTFTSRKMDWLNGVSIDPEMTPHDFQVAFCIAQCMSIERGIGVIADDTIAESTGTTRRHVLESRKRLRARGWLDWKNTRTANVYVLLGDLVEAMIDRRTDLRDRRAEARFERLPSRRLAKPVPAVEQHAVNPSAQQECSGVNQSSQHDVQCSSQHAVNPSAHIHLQCSTSEVHLEKGGLSKEETLVVEGPPPLAAFAEEPLPAIENPGLAEMKLLDELGGGDPERGIFVANRIGDARFNFLLGALTRGRLYPGAVAAARAAAGVTEEAA